MGNVTELFSLLSALTKAAVDSAIAAFRQTQQVNDIRIENTVKAEDVIEQLIADANAERDRLLSEMETPEGDGGEAAAVEVAAEALAQRVDDEIMGNNLQGGYVSEPQFDRVLPMIVRVRDSDNPTPIRSTPPSVMEMTEEQIRVAFAVASVSVHEFIQQMADNPENMDLPMDAIEVRVNHALDPDLSRRVTNVNTMVNMMDTMDTISVTAVPSSELRLPTHRNRREHPPVQVLRGQLRIPETFILERDLRRRLNLLSCRNCGEIVQNFSYEAVDDANMEALQDLLRRVMSKHVCGATRIQHPLQKPPTPTLRVIRFKAKK